MESSGAFAEAVVFLDHFEDLADPRQRGKVVYPLDEVLLLCLLAVLAGADSIVDIARFGDKKRDLLRRFRPFSDGTPSHDQLGTILAILDARMFQQCFVAWVERGYRLAPAAPWLAGAGRGWPGLAGAEIRHRGRKHARDRRQDRARDPTLHLIARSRGGATRPNYPLPLGDREQLALGHGHGLSR